MGEGRSRFREDLGGSSSSLEISLSSSSSSSSLGGSTTVLLRMLLEYLPVRSAEVVLDLRKAGPVLSAEVVLDLRKAGAGRCSSSLGLSSWLTVLRAFLRSILRSILRAARVPLSGAGDVEAVFPRVDGRLARLFLGGLSPEELDPWLMFLGGSVPVVVL